MSRNHAGRYLGPAVVLSLALSGCATRISARTSPLAPPTEHSERRAPAANPLPPEFVDVSIVNPWPDETLRDEQLANVDGPEFDLQVWIHLKKRTFKRWLERRDERVAQDEFDFAVGRYMKKRQFMQWLHTRSLREENERFARELELFTKKRDFARRVETGRSKLWRRF